MKLNIPLRFVFITYKKRFLIISGSWADKQTSEQSQRGYKSILGLLLTVRVTGKINSASSVMLPQTSAGQAETKLQPNLSAQQKDLGNWAALQCTEHNIQMNRIKHK